MSLDDYYTTTQAAELLGIQPGAVRDAVARGRLRVERLGDRNYISTAELERHRTEVLGRRGWQKRKAESAHRD